MITLISLKKQKGAEKITMMTAYDATQAALLMQAGVETVLVGDSLGMVVQGETSTVPVTMDDMLYHTQCVRRGAPEAFVISDMPFMSYAWPEKAMENAARLMQAGANMVKLEGGAPALDTVKRLTEQGIPVCAHTGLQPQSVNKLGGYFVQGRDEIQAKKMLEEALALEAAGADMLVLECIPHTLATQITEQLNIPVIGIGSGAQVDGQVLVFYDVLGISVGKIPKFSKNFMEDTSNMLDAVKQYVSDVKAGNFPETQHQFD